MFEESEANKSDLKNLRWILVYTTNTELEGRMICGNLEGAEIPAQMLSQVDSTRNFTVGGLAKVKIFVPEDYEKDAKEIIKAIFNEDGEFLD